MANTVEIDVIANDKTKGALSKISKEFSDLTGMSLGTATAIGVVSSAVSGFIKYTKQAVEDTIKYNSEMDSLSRTLGLQIEETSRLVEISSLALITQKDFTSALEAGKKNGIDITIEGLKTLSDEYLALEGSVERNTFLVENFGKAAGPEMGKLLELGSAGIDELNGKLWENLIATESTKAQAVEFQKSMVELDNISRALGVTLGSAVIPALNDFLTMILTELNKIIGKFEEFDAKWRIFYASVTTTGGLTLWNADRKENFIVPELKFAEDLSTYEAYRNYVSEILLLANLTADGYGAIRTRTGEAIDGVVILTEEEWNAQRAAEAIGDAIDDIPDASTKTINVDASFTGAAREAIGLLGGGRGRFNLGGDVIQEARAVGGAVAPNVPYLVGENGPEIFKPNAAGTIIPNGQISDYSGGGEVDYDRMARAFIEALERSSLVR